MFNSTTLEINEDCIEAPQFQQLIRIRSFSDPQEGHILDSKRSPFNF